MPNILTKIERAKKAIKGAVLLLPTDSPRAIEGLLEQASEYLARAKTLLELQRKKK